MSGPTPELADIFRQHGPAYRKAHPLPLYQHRLMQAIETCRTEVLGGSVEWCDHCQYTHTVYRSCRNRHCPKCQGLAREKWLEKRQAELLPIEYFHVVFTLPCLIRKRPRSQRYDVSPNGRLLLNAILSAHTLTVRQITTCAPIAA